MTIGAMCGAVLGMSLVAVPPAVSALSAVSPARCARVVPEGLSRNPWRAATTSLLPTSVVAARVCRYTDRLVADVVLSPSQIAGVIADSQALRTTPRRDRGRFTSCPFYDDPVVAHLAYGDGRTVTLFIRSACPISVSNGDLTLGWPRSAVARLNQDLLRLTPQRH
jgi:hypothetical protein